MCWCMLFAMENLTLFQPLWKEETFTNAKMFGTPSSLSALSLNNIIPVKFLNISFGCS